MPEPHPFWEGEIPHRRNCISCLLVIPCFRESLRLPQFLPELCVRLAELNGVEILVVDDGSGPDEANKLVNYLTELRARFPNLKPPHLLPRNLGKGGAIYAAWRLGGDYTHLAFVDADGSISPSEIIQLLNLAPDTNRILIGSRIKMLGRSVERLFPRHLMGRVYATCVSLLLGIPVYDSQCGVKLLPRDAFFAVESVLEVPGFAFDVELLAALLDHGFAVEEVPINWKEKPGGKVHFVRDSIRMFRELLQIRQKRPSAKWRRSVAQWTENRPMAAEKSTEAAFQPK